MAAGVRADRIATGHYARVRFDESNTRYQLLRSVDLSKDQTYFLWGLTQQQLARTMFPLGGMEKPEVRALARTLGLYVADKGDSQEICFVPNGDYAAFIDSYFREQGIVPKELRGEIVDRDGHVLGEHSGVHRFTVGQRRGLGIAAGEPLYVIETQPQSRRVVVGHGEELLRMTLTGRDVNWVSIAEPPGPVRAQVKIRNKHGAACATVTATAGQRFEVRFDEPQRAITPGQAAVVYDGDLVLGGGWIE
jgi:tRNA-specific 2-thiouridylase